MDMNHIEVIVSSAVLASIVFFGVTSVVMSLVYFDEIKKVVFRR
jgi:hypothetical protein